MKTHTDGDVKGDTKNISGYATNPDRFGDRIAVNYREKRRRRERDSGAAGECIAGRFLQRQLGADELDGVGRERARRKAQVGPDQRLLASSQPGVTIAVR